MSINENAVDQKKREGILELIRGREHELLDKQNILDRRKIMYPSFQIALDALCGILESSDSWNKQYDSADNMTPETLYSYANNILAFCGARGQGKTSAMLSFSGALKHYSWAKADEQLQDLLGDRRFYTLPPIDPTVLGEGDSLIELILSKIMKELTLLWNDGGRNGCGGRDKVRVNECCKHEVMMKIQTCCDALAKGKDDKGFAAARLLQTGDVFDIKVDILCVIRELLRLIGGDARKNILVIQLDDADMQMERAYGILEEVRKYLSIPNVVVLCATYLTQLRDLVSIHYRRLLREKTFEFEYMAAKYIDKLIPASQMIHLPTVVSQKASGNELGILVREKNGEKSGEGDLEQMIFDLIWERTGLTFLYPRESDRLHEMIPSTLRGIAHLYRLVDRMQRPETVYIKTLGTEGESDSRSQAVSTAVLKKVDALKTRLGNLVQFENYFLYDWCASRLTEEDRGFIVSLENMNIARSIRLACGVICDRIYPMRLHRMGEEKLETVASEWGDPADAEVVREESNYFTLWDLLLVWEEHCQTQEGVRFRSALATYFSVQLQKKLVTELKDYLEGAQTGNGMMITAREDEKQFYVDTIIKTLVVNDELIEHSKGTGQTCEGCDQCDETEEKKNLYNPWLSRMCDLGRLKCLWEQKLDEPVKHIEIDKTLLEKNLDYYDGAMTLFGNWDILECFVKICLLKQIGKEGKAKKEEDRVRKGLRGEDHLYGFVRDVVKPWLRIEKKEELGAENQMSPTQIHEALKQAEKTEPTEQAEQAEETAE